MARTLSPSNNGDLIAPDATEAIINLKAGMLSLGTAESQTVVSGVLTVTKSHVIALPESGTTDTVDSISCVRQKAGDVIVVRSPATNTITFDNSATMLLGAGTRAVAPGGCLILIAHSATVWHELAFLTAAS